MSIIKKRLYVSLLVVFCASLIYLIEAKSPYGRIRMHEEIKELKFKKKFRREKYRK
jgi:hypothetical protein